MSTEVKDFIGNPINPGDFVTYPGRRSSSLWMNLAVVDNTKGGALTVWVVGNKQIDPRWHEELHEGQKSGKYTQLNSNREWPPFYYLPLKLKKTTVICLDRVVNLGTPLFDNPDEGKLLLMAKSAEIRLDNN